jgi:hypothetical protein
MNNRGRSTTTVCVEAHGAKSSLSTTTAAESTESSLSTTTAATTTVKEKELVGWH